MHHTQCRSMAPSAQHNNTAGYPRACRLPSPKFIHSRGHGTEPTPVPQPLPSHPFCETVEISLTCIVCGQEILRGHPFRLGACFLSQPRPITRAAVVLDGPLLTGIYHAKICIRVPVFAWGNLLPPWHKALNLLLGSIQPLLSPMPCYTCRSRSLPVT